MALPVHLLDDHSYRAEKIGVHYCTEEDQEECNEEKVVEDRVDVVAGQGNNGCVEGYDVLELSVRHCGVEEVVFVDAIIH